MMTYFWGREFWGELIESLNLTEMQKKEILKYRKKLATEKQKFDRYKSILHANLMIFWLVS